METKICRCCSRELPVENFKRDRWGGHVSICIQCDTKKRKENRERRIKEVEENATKKGLSSFTPRQLMEELARRWYRGKLTYTKIEEIDIANF